MSIENVTPGEWRVVEPTTKRNPNTGYWEVESDSGLHVASNLTRADAHLLAASKKLYEALELVTKRCGPNASDGIIAHAALAAARGDQQ